MPEQKINAPATNAENYNVMHQSGPLLNGFKNKNGVKTYLGCNTDIEPNFLLTNGGINSYRESNVPWL
jgi:hypothetical protein